MLRLYGSAVIFALACASPKAAYTVHVKDFKYAPTPLHVHVGETVRFINDDDEAHTVTSNDKSFDSEGMDTGNAWDHVFEKPGTFTYFCELHPYMKGVVMVSK